MSESNSDSTSPAESFELINDLTNDQSRFGFFNFKNNNKQNKTTTKIVVFFVVDKLVASLT